MRKSKYLVLNGLYFKFNEDLTEIIEVKKLFNTQNILDILRFNKLEKISDNQFFDKNINFAYLPDNITKIGELSFGRCRLKYINLLNSTILTTINDFAFEFNSIYNLKLSDNITFLGTSSFIFCNIKYLNLSNLTQLTTIDNAFSYNNISILKLSNVITNISYTFRSNNITYLDLSKYTNLKYVEWNSFSENKIAYLKLSNNIKTIGVGSFENNNIQYLDFTNCRKLKSISANSFSNNDLKKITINYKTNINYHYVDRFKYKEDLWYKFVKYYDKTGRKSGSYEYNINTYQWEWYPL